MHKLQNGTEDRSIWDASGNTSDRWVRPIDTDSESAIGLAFVRSCGIVYICFVWCICDLRLVRPWTVAADWLLYVSVCARALVTWLNIVSIGGSVHSCILCLERTDMLHTWHFMCHRAASKQRNKEFVFYITFKKILYKRYKSCYNTAKPRRILNAILFKYNWNSNSSVYREKIWIATPEAFVKRFSYSYMWK